jgi:hypothetical protein
MNTINAKDLGNWREDSSKVIILMGDAPPHDPEPFSSHTLATVTGAAQAGGVVAAHVSGGGSTALCMLSPSVALDDSLMLSTSGSSTGPIQIYSIAIGSDSTTSSYFSALATGTGGKFYTAATAGDVVDSLVESIGDIDEPIITNNAPDCTWAAASKSEIWPPNNKMEEIHISNVTDPDGDPVTITITGITQDEPVGGNKNQMYDGSGVGTDTAWVRASRDGNGNGRVYKITFVAKDSEGAESTGYIYVSVPHDKSPNKSCTDDGQVYDSTNP